MSFAESAKMEAAKASSHLRSNLTIEYSQILLFYDV